MTRQRREDMAMRRDALRTRAALQRLQIATAIGQVRSVAMSPKGIAALALRLADSWAGMQGQGTGGRGVGARPWMLSAGWLLVRALRASPTARWIAAAGATGAALWWIVQALRKPEGGDDSG